MDSIVYLIIFLTVMLMFLVVIWENKRSEKKMDENDFTVRAPKVYLLISVLGTLFGFSMLLLIAFLSNGTDTLWVYALFLLYTVSCFIFFVYCMTWKLKVEGDQITYSPFAGIQRNFTIGDITRVRMRYGELRAFSGDKRLFIVGSIANGHSRLASRLQRELHIQFEF